MAQLARSQRAERPTAAHVRSWLAACLVVASATSGCAGSAAPSPRAAQRELASRWRYEVRVDEALTQLDATICFEGAVPDELRPGKDEAAVHLRYARWLSPGAVRRLPVEGGRIQLDGSARDACIAYGISLEDTPSMGTVMRRAGRDLVASPNVWLWRPQRRLAASRATLTITLPKGSHASLPWPHEDGVYVLDGDAFRFDSHAAFGRFTPIVFEHRGIAIEAALLDGRLAVDAQAVQRWLARAVDVTSTLSGRFPTSRLQVMVVPSGAARDPVPFGTVARGGSGSVLLFTSSTASEEELVRDWVLPHELGHLFLPFVEREHAWMSEGLATYLQEVLRARGGVISPEQALLTLARELKSACNEGTGRDMAQESRDMYRTHAFRSVYWAGAAYFLLADVALRRETNGAKSLDGVLEALHTTGAFDHTWSAPELIARMDELAGVRVFAPLADECMGKPFPDFEPTLEALGVRARGESLALVDDAPLTHVREAIFAPR